jgi:pumilio RNA-binding family
MKIRENLIKSFEANCIEIVEDAFGNYAIQFAVDIFGSQSCGNLIDIISSNILSLSNQKFSSNVVEKCIQVADRVSKNLIYRNPSVK